MAMIRATMTRWPKDNLGFAVTEDGDAIFIHQNLLSASQIETPRHLFVGRSILCEVVEGRPGSNAKYAASSFRFVDDQPMPAAGPRVAQPLPMVNAPSVVPQPEKPLHKAIAAALGMIDEPQRRTTKRDRLKGL